jgi:hypothetical protein
VQTKNHEFKNFDNLLKLDLAPEKSEVESEIEEETKDCCWSSEEHTSGEKIVRLGPSSPIKEQIKDEKPP